MKEVAFQSEILVFLDDLVISLLENDYFGFVESAVDYVNWLYDTILEELPSKMHYSTPPELAHYGKFYIKIKSNKRTLWYVFFEKMNSRFLVQFITNTHTPQSSFLNKL